MYTRHAPGGAWRVWRILLRSQLREQPGRLALNVLTIALGVALASAIFMVNSAALAEFTGATRRLVGDADVIVRGPAGGFAEGLFAQLARDPAVAVASPVVEIDAAIAGRTDTLQVIGLDPFRAGALQPALVAGLAGATGALFRPDSIVLSAAAAAAAALKAGDTLTVIVGNRPRRLRVAAVMPQSSYSQPLGLMDIASAQWLFGWIGRLNRIDLRLADGAKASAFRAALAGRLPAGVFTVAPGTEINRAANVTRAYRVNLNMLALIALWTGAFFVFSTQSLSVLRRRGSLALLRALGVTRGELERALAAEGALVGAIGALLGIAGGALLASGMLRVLAGDLGNGQLRVAGAALDWQPWALAGFFGVGVLVSAAGAWVPARAAARLPPALALKGGAADTGATARIGWRLGCALGAVGLVLAWLPPVGHLPLFGYASIAALLFGAVALVPAASVALLRVVPRTGRVTLDTAVAQLRDNVGVATLSLASIIVSFSLMVAMAIMVHSFRQSFTHWLDKLLPADIEMRVPPNNDTAYFSPGEQRRIAATPGIARIEFRRTLQVALDDRHAPVTLIARDISPATAARVLPILRQTRRTLPQDPPPVWVSEAMVDLYGAEPGNRLTLPLGGRWRPFTVAGVWRDYARSTGAVVVGRAAYVAATGDRTATEASLWLAPGYRANGVRQAIRRRLGAADAVQITTSTTVRARSLRIFDRAFTITYALEAIAVLIGLAGIAFAIGSTAIARRAEFGLLRHIGMRRAQIVAMLAEEGVIMSALGVLYGLLLGFGLSLVLVFVVNRQSFDWSIDLAVPIGHLCLLGAILVAAAALTAVWSGRAAVGGDALRAVREDW